MIVKPGMKSSVDKGFFVRMFEKLLDNCLEKVLETFWRNSKNFLDRIQGLVYNDNCMRIFIGFVRPNIKTGGEKHANI